MKWKDYIAEGLNEIKPTSNINVECPNLEVDISVDYGHKLCCREDTYSTTVYFDCKSCKRICNKKEFNEDNFLLDYIEFQKGKITMWELAHKNNITIMQAYNVLEKYDLSGGMIHDRNW